ncbi:Uncharacterised protein [Mycobacteroides abscessus]|nr:hypothetical protein [Mycobacteroides abscessus]CPS22170.1 Uncharacterised protein [Mycobacteroides abscessus]CPS73438.1 Uncharacterised protein [Mycobacteroides abscessus]CPY87764.1 Uncharacterised protein [Mycobacteroides abscessus]CPY88345.1 Uncharacterised protein [Mycobacteroides abscessus]SLJ54329.1 Uncharacterised protein [Mycobacteroides abscessus subsp. abscessus]
MMSNPAVFDGHAGRGAGGAYIVAKDAGSEDLSAAPPSGPAWSGRALRLPEPPTTEHAADLAQRAVDAAYNVSGVELDYTPASLNLVDDILRGFREPGSDAVAETIFVFGCYVGEVLIRNAGYEWINTPTELGPVLGPLTIYCASTATHASPIWRAFKCVDNGDTDTVAYFYRVFSTESEPA